MADTSNSGPQPAWSVIDVSDDTALVGAQFQRVKKITFRLATGQVSFVTVPLANFNPEAVKAAIDEHALQLFGVMGLTGPLLPS